MKTKTIKQEGGVKRKVRSWREWPSAVLATAQTTCTVNNLNLLGVCIDSSSCTGTSTPGYCPGAANIQCYTDPRCSVLRELVARQRPARVRRSYAGYCTGPANLQCCISCAPLPSPGRHRIVIDPGHGGSDPTCRCVQTASMNSKKDSNRR